MKRILSASILSIILVLTMTTQTTQAANFKDVPTSYWAYSDITKLSKAKVIDGFTDGTFKPGANVTRAQAAKIIANALKIKPTSNFTPKFIDISPSHFAYEEICALAERGIIANSIYFHPDQPLTRAQMSKILINGFNIITDDNHLVHFYDVPNDYWHNYIITLAEIEISKGISPTRFDPNGNVTRAQLSAFTSRALEFDAKREVGTIYYDDARKMYMDKNKPEPFPEVTDVPATAAESARLVNVERQKQHLAPLTLDLELSKIAQIKAQEMADKGYFDHTSPTYGTPAEMVKHFQYTYILIGENIAWNYQTPQKVTEGWMHSDGHRANILNARYTNIGVGFSVNKTGEPYWVHLFSRK